MTALTSILDSEAPADDALNGGAESEALHFERARREAAEAEAEGAARKLSVAQTQFAEYLLQRAADEEALGEAAARLAATLAAAAAAPEALAAAAAKAVALRDALAAAAAEARATAEQVAAESAREAAAAKRGAATAELSGADAEAKRSRDAPPSDAEDGEEEVGNGDAAAANEASNGDVNGASNGDVEMAPASQPAAAPASDSFRARARYIPLRLTPHERRLLRLLEGALNVSEYTDKVDVLSWKSRAARVHAQIKDLCAILCGLLVAQDFREGQRLIADRDFAHAELAAFFQDALEVGRRYKCMNPDAMRGTYGKLLHICMDAADPEIIDLVGFRAVRPLRTVYTLLEEGDALALLDDPLVAAATADIAPPAPGAPRADVQRAIKGKERARAALAKRYATRACPEEALLRALYSISDNNSYLAGARDPVDAVLAQLRARFPPDAPPTPALSLAIGAGRGGARLSHSHARQFQYVAQSLTLWREIAHDMFRLWCVAEGDLLAEGNRYRLSNTGQGLQRVQSAPGVSRAMAGVLAKCRAACGGWVGSSVVHLGDSAVPNAFTFLDKYSQVPRILGPLAIVLAALPSLGRGDAALAAYVDGAFGGAEAARLALLADFFRHAFDGSGADSFFDAGSCIDGRLTSAWNWCSKLETKSYHTLFLLAGFTSFDGDF